MSQKRYFKMFNWLVLYNRSHPRPPQPPALPPPKKGARHPPTPPAKAKERRAKPQVVKPLPVPVRHNARPLIKRVKIHQNGVALRGVNYLLVTVALKKIRRRMNGGYKAATQLPFWVKEADWNNRELAKLQLYSFTGVLKLCHYARERLQLQPPSTFVNFFDDIAS